MKSLFIIFCLLVLSSCSSYKWVDTSDCKDRVKELAKCKIID